MISVNDIPVEKLRSMLIDVLSFRQALSDGWIIKDSDTINTLLAKLDPCLKVDGTDFCGTRAGQFKGWTKSVHTQAS